MNAAGRGGPCGLAAWKGLCEGEEAAPTFGCRGALSIRGFRACFLRSVFGGGLQERCWNIHNKPLSPSERLPLPTLPFDLSVQSFGAANHSAWNPDAWNAAS